MKRKNRKQKSEYRSIKEPFKKAQSDTLGMQYQRYLNDPERKIEINSRTYYKIIQLILFRNNNIETIAVLDNEMDLRVGDVLIDEKDQIFKISGFAMFRFVDPTFPDWYLKVSHVALDGNIQEIGDYLAKYKK